MKVIKQRELRANQKKYFDMVCDEDEVIFLARNQNKNVVIMSEDRYNNMNKNKDK